MLRSRFVIFIMVLLFIVSIACGVSFDSGASKSPTMSPAEQTLQAIYAQDTMQALAASSNAQPAAPAAAPESSPQAPAAPTATSITHVKVPGNPGSPDVKKDDINTSNTASDMTAVGDSYRLGNFERPFTQTVMDYSQQVDLLQVTLAKDPDFYIFDMTLVGSDPVKGYPAAHYAIEMDTDLDMRGDILLWVQGNGQKDWNIADVMVLQDSNDDVGGSRPVLPDTNPGNGYDKVLLSADHLTDPDAAWQRMISTGNIQLAVKTSLVGSPRFFFKAWADNGVADPAKFDYNDSYSEEQAGSPVKTSSLYPVGQIFLVDSTCWIAFNYEPKGTELGGCYQLVQPTPVPTKKTPTKVPPPPTCSCSSGCSGLSQSCCAQCASHGCVWAGHCQYLG
jgi:hypothetical protein